MIRLALLMLVTVSSGSASGRSSEKALSKAEVQRWMCGVKNRDVGIELAKRGA